MTQAKLDELLIARLGARPSYSPTPVALHLAARAERSGSDPEALLDTLAAEPEHAEWPHLLDVVLNAETSFLRDEAQLGAAVAHLGRRGLRTGVQVWCAGCANGAEAYSVAMLLLEEGIEGTVVASDINPHQLRKAKRKLYSAWDLRRVDDERRQRWFRASAAGFEVVKDLSRVVRLERHNLLGAPLLPRTGKWDLIFCRNVVMYYPQEVGYAVVRRLTGALAPEGLLVLAAGEALYGDSPELLARALGDRLAYAASMEGDPVDEAPPIAVATPEAAPPPTPPADVEAAVAACVARGLSALERRDLEEATRELEAATVLAPLWADAHALLGVLFRKRRRWVEARRALRSAAYLSPDAWWGPFLLAGVELRLGELREARHQLRQAERLLRQPQTPRRPDEVSCLSGLLPNEEEARRMVADMLRDAD